MKPELWLITPLSAIVAGGAAMLFQPHQPLAPLIGSGVGAFATAPLLERRERHSQTRQDREWQQHTTRLQDMVEQVRSDVQASMGDLSRDLESSLQQLSREFHADIQTLLETFNRQQILDSLEQVQQRLDTQAHELQRLQDALQKPVCREQKTPRTAVLYDIENLVFLQGQRLTSARVRELVSLENVLATIQKTIELGEIVLQRSYGNWSNNVLQSLSPQLDQLQIQRVAVYGRNRDQRNAADIQLAVDATDIVHQYPDINTFVLVSGDGGFGSIALKLRDYGKTVIGCAYQESASDSLQRVCHHFILLENPFTTNGQTPAPPAKSPKKSDTPPPSPLNTQQTPIPVLVYPDNAHPTDIKALELAKIIELVNFYAADPTKEQPLVQGMDFITFFKDLKSIIPQLDPLRFGFSKPSELIAYVTEQHGLPLCLAVNRSRQKAILCWRERLPENSEIRVYEPGSIHTVSMYRSIFADELAGDPLLIRVGEWLIVNRPRHMAVRQVNHSIVESFRRKQLPVSNERVRRALANYQKANVVSRSQSSGGDTLSLNAKVKTFTDLVTLTQTSFRQVLQDRLASLGEVIEEAVFAKAVPFARLPQEPQPNSESLPS